MCIDVYNFYQIMYAIRKLQIYDCVIVQNRRLIPHWWKWMELKTEERLSGDEIWAETEKENQVIDSQK